MTRSTVNPLGRLLVALALTLAAMFGSVGFATAASADDDDRSSSSSQSSSHDHDHDDDDKDDDDKDDDDKDDDDKDDDDKDDDDKDAEKAAKAAEKAAEEAAKAAEKAAEEAAKAAEKAAEEAAKAAEKAAEEAAKNPAPIVVEYGDGDVIDRLGTVVKAKAPQLTAKYDAVAPLLRNLLANHLTKKGATVTTDSRGKLVIAPYLCDKKKLTILQPGCVTVMPTTGGPRF